MLNLASRIWEQEIENWIVEHLHGKTASFGGHLFMARAAGRQRMMVRKFIQFIFSDRIDLILWLKF